MVGILPSLQSFLYHRWYSSFGYNMLVALSSGVQSRSGKLGMREQLEHKIGINVVSPKSLFSDTQVWCWAWSTLLYCLITDSVFLDWFWLLSKSHLSFLSPGYCDNGIFSLSGMLVWILNLGFSFSLGFRQFKDCRWRPDYVFSYFKVVKAVNIYKTCLFGAHRNPLRSNVPEIHTMISYLSKPTGYLDT